MRVGGFASMGRVRRAPHVVSTGPQVVNSGTELMLSSILMFGVRHTVQWMHDLCVVMVQMTTCICRPRYGMCFGGLRTTESTHTHTHTHTHV